MLFTAASAHTLAMMRVVCFSIWLTLYATEPLPRLADFPPELYRAPGVIGVIPASVTAALLTPAGLWTVQALLMVSLVAVVLGVRPHRWIALPTAVLLVLADGIAKGHGGYLNHRQFAPLYCAMVLAMFPSSDEFSVCGRAPVRRDPRLWKFAALVLGLVVSLPYSFVGARRLAAGIDVFYEDDLIVWIATRSLMPGDYAFRTGLAVLEHPWLARSLQAGFGVVTLAEVLAPLALLSRRFRVAWLAVVVPFQISTVFTMNIGFWENVLLMLLLFTGFAYRIGTRAGAAPPIVFYDGVCGLCDGFVRWVQRRDVDQVFRFAPLQGETAAARLGSREGDQGLPSIVLLDGDGRHERSDAALRIACALGSAWGIAGSLFLYVPRPLRDAVYRFIAARRYAWFGRLDACPVPSPEQRRVMLP